jgi:4-amino-4-deoxy-L-arabinose transferase-like glycosyltransferase
VTAPLLASDVPAEPPAERPPRRIVAALSRHRHRLFAFVVVALLAQMATGMIVSAAGQTPTTDEPVYVGAAVTQLDQHTFRYNFEHPPLGKLLIGAGLAFEDLHVPPGFAGDQTELGRQILYGSGRDPGRLMLLARLPVIGVTLLFGLVVFAFARDLVGPGAALVALALYAFSPDLIAHGSLATLDVPAYGLLVTAVWLLWRARARPRRYLPLAALALGAAVATRASVLPAVPVFLLLVLLTVWQRGRTWRAFWTGVAAAVGAGLAALATVWLVYLVVDPRLRWTPPADLPSFGGLHKLLLDVMPFPEPFRDGMAVQFKFERQSWGGFLFGRQYDGALWYYQPVAVLVKTPLGMLALWLAGVAALLGVRRLRPAAPYLLLPPAVLFAATLFESRNFGTRYVIFLPMFLAVAAATVAAVRWRWMPTLVTALVLFVAVSSLRTFPYYIPYSNEAFGGPSKTYLRLHDSNSDWGQDLGRVAELIHTKYPGEPVWLAYQGGADPRWYGFDSPDATSVPAARVRGLLVVSNDRIDKSGTRLRFLMATSTRLAEVGHSMTIFRRP